MKTADDRHFKYTFGFLLSSTANHLNWVIQGSEIVCTSVNLNISWVSLNNAKTVILFTVSCHGRKQ